MRPIAIPTARGAAKRSPVETVIPRRRLFHATKYFASQRGTDSRRRDDPPPTVQRDGIAQLQPQPPIQLEPNDIGQRLEKHVEISADVSKSEVDWETHKRVAGADYRRVMSRAIRPRPGCCFQR